LVAYIIAAKYRCSVELATLLQEQYRSDASNLVKEESKQEGDSVVGEDAIGRRGIGREQESIDQRICEARSHAEVILSNQAWVQLLSLGSFMRPIPPTASTSATNSSSIVAASARTSSSQPMNRSKVLNATGTPEQGARVEPKPLPIQSIPISTTTADVYSAAVTASKEGQWAQTISPPPSNSTSPSTPLPPSSILQVEDLDRMESEFLTFLDYDLAARSQDLDTCWGLLVGNKDA